MVRLLNRQQGIPGGIQFYQPETNWNTQSIPELRGRSFEVIKMALISHRLGNRWLAEKHGWATDQESVGNELELFNALRMKKNPAWAHFIVEDESGGSSLQAPFHFPKHQGRLASAVDAAKKTVAGVGVLLRMFGSGGKPVVKELAERRAAVCATGGPGGTKCSMNKPGDISTFFTEAASSEIFKMFGILNDMKISTSRDSELGVCSGCLCPLKGKVQTSLAHIKSEMKPEWKTDLSQENPKCWLLTELESA